MEAALATREVRIVENFESIRRSLDEYRQCVEARERALDAREAEANRREEQVAQAELDLNRNREGLETHEGDLAQAMARHEEEVTHHKGHVKKVDERLARRKADQDQEQEARLHAAQTQVSKEYASKFKR